MTEIEKALIHYDGDGSKPYCDLVWRALKLLQLIDNSTVSEQRLREFLKDEDLIQEYDSLTDWD